MIASSQVSGLADLAEAAYLNFDLPPSGGWRDDGLRDQLSKAAVSWPAARRDEFIQHWRVIAHQPNTGTGFSATLFERVHASDGQPRYVVAMRGTEGNVVGQLYPDLLDADLADLVANGLAWKQIIDMYNWWQMVTTPPNAALQRIEAVPIPLIEGAARVAAGHNDVILEATEAWQLALLKNEWVTGHEG